MARRIAVSLFAAASLSSVTASAQDPLLQDGTPLVSHVLSTQQVAFAGLSEKVGVLKKQLAEAAHDHMVTVEAQKREYEIQLRKQRQNITKLEVSNQKLEHKLVGIKDMNAGIRSMSLKLKAKCATLTTDLEQLQGNMTTALAFAKEAINTTEELMAGSELLILPEIEEQNAAKLQSEVRSATLARVRRASQTALLQTLDGRISGVKEDLLASLASSLEDISAEEDESLESLKESFDADYAVNEERLATLQKENDKLASQVEDAKVMTEKLTKAMDRLTERHRDLLKKAKSLRGHAKEFSAPRNYGNA